MKVPNQKLMKNLPLHLNESQFTKEEPLYKNLFTKANASVN